MDEYIKREEAIEDVDNLADYMSVSTSIDMCLGMKSMKSRALSALNDIPAADVVGVRHGNWIHREDFDYVDNKNAKHWHGMCDQCGFIHDFLDCHTGQYNYCPNCGAKMGDEDVQV